MSHTHSPSNDIVVTRQKVHANVVNFTGKIINNNYWSGIKQLISVQIT